MLLQCTHSDRGCEHLRSDSIGNGIVCPACELTLAWCQAHIGADTASARKRAITEVHRETRPQHRHSTRNER